jgi:hypothetical protein
MYVVYPHDSALSAFVLRRMGEHKLVVMEEYQDLVCQKCGKVDEKAALVRGIRPGIVVKSKRPLIPSEDDFYLVNERGKKVFSEIVPDEIDYYRIPASDFYVASARTWLQPREGDPGVRFLGGRCNACGRAKEVFWGKGPVQLGQIKPFLCLNLEKRLGAFPLWLVSQEVAEELKKPAAHLAGVVFAPQEVEDGRPLS